jgi:hypothetical protein
VNRFSPLYALGSTVDRVPSNATDVFFRPDQIQKVLSAGWGVVSYRQNTDLFVQAWHWNPKGTWSDPAGKGYFTGDATPTSEMIVIPTDTHCLTVASPATEAQNLTATPASTTEMRSRIGKAILT